MLQKLFRRRVPHYLIGYLGGFWLLTELLNHATQRYGISPFWADTSFLLMLVMLPSIALFAWNHGEPGEDRWRRSELIFFGLNAILAVALLIAQASTSRKPGAAESTDPLLAKKQQSATSKQTYRMILLAPLTMADPQDWRAHGIPVLVNYDLLQTGNLFGGTLLSSRNYLSYVDQGYPNAVGLPETVLLGYARDQANYDFLLTGNLAVEDGNGRLSAKLELIDVKKGKMFKQFSLEADTSDTLADKITQRLLLETGYKAGSENVDLPVSSILSRSEPAMEAMLAGYMAGVRQESPDKILAQYDNAVKLDPTFALVWYAKGAVLYSNNRRDEAKQALLQARKLSDRLPMTLKVQVDVYLAFIDYDYDKAVALLQHWVKMTPADSTPMLMLASLYASLNRTQEANQAYRQLLEYNPDDLFALRALADSAAGAADYKQAMHISERLLALNPKDAANVQRLIENQWNAGNFAQARAMLPKLELLDTKAAVDLKVSFDLASGDYEEAEEQFRALIGQTTEKNARNAYINSYAQLQEKQGRISEAYALIAPGLTESRRQNGSAYVADLSNQISIVAQAKGEKFALDMIDATGAESNDNAVATRAPLLLTTYVALGDNEKLPGLISQLEAYYSGAPGKSGAYETHMLRWKITAHMARDEVGQAEQAYRQLIGLQQKNQSFGRPIERVAQICQHAGMLARLGKIDEARTELNVAERIAPGAASVVIVRYLIASRTGDVRSAKEAKAWLDKYYAKAEASSSRLRDLQKLYAIAAARAD